MRTAASAPLSSTVPYGTLALNVGSAGSILRPPLSWHNRWSLRQMVPEGRL